MKKLVVSDVDEELSGKMIDFAGYLMAVVYEGVNAEHLTVRENVGGFDVSHMGEIFIAGEKSEELLQYITSNDVSKLKQGKVQYSYFPNTSGGIVDDLLVYKLDDNEFMLVVNASNLEKDLAWIKDRKSVV